MRSFNRYWLTMLFLLLTTLSVNAQSGGTTGSIVGTVRDAQGGVIVGAEVTVRQLETNLMRSVLVGEDGLYQLVQLPPGKYQLEVIADGFTGDKATVVIDIGRTEVAKFTLAVMGSADVVEVQASQGLDERKTESATNIESMSIANLPIDRRDFINFSLTSARVTRDRLPSQGAAATSGLSFNGQTARANNITIDGLDNNDNFSNSVRATFSQDAVQEFQIVSDGFAAEFGRALAGIVNIVTKGGSNDLHGKLFFLNRNDNISARDAFALEKPPYRQYQFGSSVSGPIKKDRGFFFTSFERRSIRQNNIVTIADETVRIANRRGYPVRNGAVPFAVGETNFLFRSDLQLTANNRLWLRYNYGGNYNGALERFGELSAESNGGVQRLNDNTFATNNTYINGNLNLVNDTRFLYSHREQAILPIDPSATVRLVAPEGFVNLGRGPFLPQMRNENIYQFVNTVSLSRGNNLIKFGIDLLYINFPDHKTNLPIVPTSLSVFAPIDFSVLANMPGLPLFSGLEAFDPSIRTPAQRAFLTALSPQLPVISPGFPGNLRLADLPLPSVFLQGFGNTPLELSQKLFAGFIQDDLKLRPNLLIKAGLRYDINRVRFVPQNNGNFAPRLGMVYQPAPLPNLVLRASYGLFFSGVQSIGTIFPVQNTSSGRLTVLSIPLPFSILAYDLPGHSFPESDQIPSSVPFTPQLNQIFQYDKNLRNSYTQQINAGFEYQVQNNNLLGATYVFIRGIKGFAARNINPVVRPDSINPIINAINGRVDPALGDIFQFESAFDSYYHALTLSYQRRFSNRLGFLATYTWSKAIDNFIDLRSDLQEANDPLIPRNERGLSLQDVRSRFVLSGIAEIGTKKSFLLSDYQLSSIITLESGRPYNLVTGVDINMNGDNGAGDRPLGLGRNVGITPAFASVDLRFTRTFNSAEKYRVQIFIEAFNLFNRVNISTIDRVFSPDAQGNFRLPVRDGGRFTAPKERFRNAFAPRQLQFGFNVSF